MEIRVAIVENIGAWLRFAVTFALIATACWLVHRHLISKFGEYPVLSFFVDRSLETALFGIASLVSMYSIVHVNDGLIPHFAPGLAVALSYFAVWWNSRRVVRHHLLAAVATALLAASSPLLFPGSSPDHQDGLLAHPEMIVILAVLSLAAILDYLLLLDLRDIAGTETPVTVESSPE